MAAACQLDKPGQVLNTQQLQFWGAQACKTRPTELTQLNSDLDLLLVNLKLRKTQ